MHKRKMANFISIWDHINEKGVSCEKQQEHFHLAGDGCVQQESHHTLLSSVGFSALGMHLHD